MPDGAGEEFRRIALQAGRVGVWRWDTRAGRGWGDAAFRALWGMLPSEAPHPVSDFTRLMTPAGGAAVEAAMAGAAAADEEFDAEVEVASGPAAGRWIGWRGRAEPERPWILDGVGFDVTARRRESERLRESEERFRAMAAGIEDVFYLTDLEHDALLYLSPSYERVWGRPAAELMADLGAFEATIHPEDLPALKAGKEVQRRGEPVRIEYRIVRPDGAVRWILDRSFVVAGSEGRRSAGVATDITARVEAEAATRESDERLRQFGEASSDVLWIRDAVTLQWEYLSPAFERIYGLSRDEALAGDTMLNWQGLILPEDRAHAVANIGRVREGEHAVFEYRIRRPADGQVRWMRDTDFPMRDAAGRVVRVGGLGQDVTELKAAQAAIAASEARLRTLVEGVPELVWRSRDAGQWTWSSPQWQRFTGQDDAQSHGLGWLDAVHPDDREAAKRAWDAAPGTGLLDVEYRVRRAADGAWIWHHTRAAPVRGAGGQVVEWLGVSADIEHSRQAREVLARGRMELERLVAERTSELELALQALRREAAERGQAEDALRQAQKMDAIGRLTGGIAHDFNNMLQGVTGALDLSQRRIAEGQPEAAPRYLAAAREAATRAAGLTRRLLAFARRQRLDPRAVDPEALLTGVAELVRRTVGSAIAVEMNLREATEGFVVCDPNELESAILNLAINARDAMPCGGRLVLGTAEARLRRGDIPQGEEAVPGGYIELHVGDTGTGMMPEVLARVTEPFFTTKPQGQGTGLGLSQVYGFARQSGGLLRIESQPGIGTTVRLLLPRRQGSAAANEKVVAEAPDHVAGQPVVMLVDDEAGVRGPAAERLRELGYRVVEASDGPEALRLVQADPCPDLVVTDVGLPGGMNGRQVAEAIRELCPDMPVMFISGWTGDVLAPGTEVIGKPFELDALARRVQAMLQKGMPGRPDGALAKRGGAP